MVDRLAASAPVPPFLCPRDDLPGGGASERLWSLFPSSPQSCPGACQAWFMLACSLSLRRSSHSSSPRPLNRRKVSIPALLALSLASWLLSLAVLASGGSCSTSRAGPPRPWVAGLWMTRRGSHPSGGLCSMASCLSGSCFIPLRRRSTSAFLAPLDWALPGSSLEAPMAGCFCSRESPRYQGSWWLSVPVDPGRCGIAGAVRRAR